MEATGRKVLMGTCGVEVDTTTYAIPKVAVVQKWVESVPRGFRFHFKAFGLLVSKSCPWSAIPGVMRQKLSVVHGDYVALASLSDDVRLEIWGIFNAAVRPACDAGCLGAVLFQFQLTCKPTEESRRHIRWCRQMLDQRYPMAGKGNQQSGSRQALARQALAVASFSQQSRPLTPGLSRTNVPQDTMERPFSFNVPCGRFPERLEVWDRAGALVQEVAYLPLAEDIPITFNSVRPGRRSINWRPDRPASLYWVETQDGGDAKVEVSPRDIVREIMPMAWEATIDDFFYIRLHRREGTQKLLPPEELSLWADRLLHHLPPQLKGPVYFLWGTDHEDQPIVNARRLAVLLGDMVYDWRGVIQQRASKTGLRSFFSPGAGAGPFKSIKGVVSEGEAGHTGVEAAARALPPGTGPGVGSNACANDGLLLLGGEEGSASPRRGPPVGEALGGNPCAGDDGPQAADVSAGEAEELPGFPGQPDVVLASQMLDSHEGSAAPRRGGSGFVEGSKRPAERSSPACPSPGGPKRLDRKEPPSKKSKKVDADKGARTLHSFFGKAKT
eukprot:jgi/Mesen1/2454/ME000158S01652